MYNPGPKCGRMFEKIWKKILGFSRQCGIPSRTATEMEERSDIRHTAMPISPSKPSLYRSLLRRNSTVHCRLKRLSFGKRIWGYPDIGPVVFDRMSTGLSPRSTPPDNPRSGYKIRNLHPTSEAVGCGFESSDLL